MNPSGFSVDRHRLHDGDPSYTSWANPAQVEVVETDAWKQMRCPLASITRSASGGSDLTVDPACWNNNHSAVPNPGFPYNGAGLPGMDGITWLENAYQLLGTPGQFYLDNNAGYLYYVPRAGRGPGDSGRRTASGTSPAGRLRHPGAPGAGERHRLASGLHRKLGLFRRPAPR